MMEKCRIFKVKMCSIDFKSLKMRMIITYFKILKMIFITKLKMRHFILRTPYNQCMAIF